MSKKLRCLGFDKGLVESLTRHGLLCCKDVLNKSAVELMMMLKISIQTSTYIIEKASEACKPLHLTALDLLEKNKFNSFLMTSLKPLDDVLKGGLLFSSITEIAGPPGCGKTQFCFMLSVNYLTFNNEHVGNEQIKNSENHLLLLSDKGSGLCCGETNTQSNACSKKLNKSVVYIDTEGAFDADRLLEIASARYGNVYVNEQSLLDMVSKVYVFRERSLQSLVNRLDSLEDFVVMHNVGLIILDSIASLIRREFNASIRSNIFERNKVLTRQATQLKHLASSFHIPVIITNQITTQFKKPSDVNILHKDNCKVDEDNKCYALDDTTKNESTVVALGTYWTHCVNSRILLQYTEMHTLRELCLVKSSQAPPLKLFYTIDSRGLNIEGEPEFEYCVGSGVHAKYGLRPTSC